MRTALHAATWLLLGLIPLTPASARDTSVPGLSLDVTAATDLMAVVAGGLKRDTATPAVLGITAGLSTREAGLWDGGEFALSYFGVTGTDPSDISGDIQDASNLAFIGSARVYEAWYEHTFDGGTRILAGLRDVNSDFYTLDSAETFLNGSFGIGQEIAQDNLPTWAITAPGVRIYAPLGDGVYAQAAVYDGIPGDPTNPYGTHVRFDKGDGVLTIAETGWVDAANTTTKIAAGAWHNTAEFIDFAARTRDSDWGAYLVAETDVGARLLGREGLAGFIQFGYSAEDRNPVGYYAGLGGALTGPWAVRPKDVLGLAVAHARTAAGVRDYIPGIQRGETVIELTYQMAPWPWLVVQPDVQYVFDPAANPTIDNTLIVGLRLGVNF